MGKASSRKKVARIARTGGGRTGRGGTGAWVWPSVLALVVVLGVVLVVTSRSGNDVASGTPPKLNTGGPDDDHWHAALAVYVCGEQLPAVPDFGDPEGIHTHNDGVIHIHPFSNRVTGDRAVLGVFLNHGGIDATATSLKLPLRDELKNGDECPDGKKGEVQLVVRTLGEGGEGRPVEGDPNDLKLEDGQLITLAFMPEGEEIPPPPADRIQALINPSDLPGGQTPQAPPATAPPDTSGGTDATAPPGTAPPDTAPSESPTTTP